jgi:hypothetical protein
MPRYGRRLWSTGIYHVMLRGVNQQQILEDREDNTKIAFVGITTPWMLRSPTFKYSGTKMDISYINTETR